MVVNDNGLICKGSRQLVPGASVEKATIHFLVDATPLLEEEGDTGIGTLVTDTPYPL